MLKPALEQGIEADKAIHFGIITRPDEPAAWQAARDYFPEHAMRRAILDFSMRNTDSVWKQRLKAAADQPEHGESGYWLAPFRNFMADCPYFVGDHQRVALLIQRLVERGITMFILDLPAAEEEFQNTNAAFMLAREALIQKKGELEGPALENSLPTL